MKKYLILILISVAFLIGLVGCSSKIALDKQVITSAKTDTIIKSEPNTDTKPKSEKEPTKTIKYPISKEDIIVGFVFDGNISDNCWTYAHNEGRLALEKELGVITLYKEAVSESSKCRDVVKEMIDSGATVIFATSYGFMDYILKLGDEYPDVKFFHCGGSKFSDNVVNYFGRNYQARYLSGVVAGLTTKTNKVGYVAAFETPDVLAGINAFYLGLTKANEKASLDVMYTFSWWDKDKEKKSAHTLVDMGCDVLTHHQGTQTVVTCSQELGVYSIGYCASSEKLAQNSYLTAPIINFAPYYVREVKNIMNGTWKADNYYGDISDGMISLDTLSKLVPKEANTMVDKYIKLMKTGSFHVFEGPIYNQSAELVVEKGKYLSDNEISNMAWYVNGISVVK